MIKWPLAGDLLYEVLEFFLYRQAVVRQVVIELPVHGSNALLHYPGVCTPELFQRIYMRLVIISFIYFLWLPVIAAPVLAEVILLLVHGFGQTHPAIMVYQGIQRLHPQLFIITFAKTLCIAVRKDIG